MATSSITKNFVISSREQVEMFVNAIEESAKNRPVHLPVAAREIKGETELREIMRLRKMKINEKKEYWSEAHGEADFKTKRGLA